jgi:hypothetical protein
MEPSNLESFRRQFAHLWKSSLASPRSSQHIEPKSSTEAHSTTLPYFGASSSLKIRRHKVHDTHKLGKSTESVTSAPVPTLLYKPSTGIPFLPRASAAPALPDISDIYGPGKMPQLNSGYSAEIPLLGNVQDYRQQSPFYEPLQCVECPKIFYNYLERKLHEQTHTVERDSKSKASFRCKHCGQSFSQKAALIVSCSNAKVAEIKLTQLASRSCNRL